MAGEQTLPGLPGDRPDALLSPVLSPMFRRPSRLGVESAWFGHVPFAHWIVAQARPSLLVELGTHNGVSYAAFCDSVREHGLATRCFAVDSWQGDEHAGFYGEDVFTDLQRFHEQRYGTFSRLLRCRFDEALPYIPDASVDLLHIDGRHGYDDVRADYESWIPKLSPGAVVLFHDTNVRERDFGVWRLWAELRDRYPSFEFLHCHGLGVLAVGRQVAPAIGWLCALDAAGIGQVRERFALLGERWELQQDLDGARRAVLEHARAAEETRAWAERVQVEAAPLRPRLEAAESARRTLRLQLAEARTTVAGLERTAREDAAARAALADALAQAHQRDAMQVQAAAGQQGELSRLRAELSQLHGRIAATDAEVLRLHEDRRLILGSTAWRVTAPLRRTMGLLRPGRGGAVMVEQPVSGALTHGSVRIQSPAPLPAAAGNAPDQAADAAPSPALNEPRTADHPEPADRIQSAGRVLFLSGEPHTPGSTYRVERYAASARALGWQAEARGLRGVDDSVLRGVDVVVLWRVPFEGHIEGILSVCRAQGTPVVFDIDDLMILPELARVEVIDGIRSQRFSEEGTREFFARIRRTMDECDLVTCTTAELASHIQELQRPVLVLPNGFDDGSLAASRLAVRRRRQSGDGEGLLRIGYAGGSRTHQRDFAQCVDALAGLLQARPEARLVLFRDPSSGEGVLLAGEFEQLKPVASQIEWRDMVTLQHLPAEMARFDINLAPLELGNPFCEAKSELKFFEAALVDVPTIASPVGPFARAIRHDETGLLAATDAQWTEALHRLADDASLRRRLARSALYDVMWRFGPHRRAEALHAALEQARGGRSGARAFRAGLFAPPQDSMDAERLGRAGPTLVPAEVLLEQDLLREAAVTVVVPVYNYAEYVLEALDSVRLQTLELLDLVVVDDRSTDESLSVVMDWLAIHAARFNRVVVVRHEANSGLGPARNTGFDRAETPFVLPLDADNRLMPSCCEALLGLLGREGGAAFAYPAIRSFGTSEAVFGTLPYSPARLATGNYIDAMALVAKWAWAAAGGYDHVRFGWEDYDFWCRLVELGLWGENHPQELAQYRVHGGSMLHTTTEIRANKRQLVEDMQRRHSWLAIAGKRLL